MKSQELFALLQQFYPNEAAVSWDNVGLLCGRKNKEIKKVYIGLDATSKVIDEAVAVGADLILTHHPVIFSGMKRIVEGDFIGERLIKMLENNISCYAMHTNYDIKRMADLVAERMELLNLQVLEATVPDGSEGIGYTGDLKEPMSLKDYALKIKEWFNLPDVRVFGDLDQMITRVSVCPGSAKGMEGFAIAQNSEVLIGGDFGHHEGLDCLEKGVAVIDAGHYGLEHVFIEDMKMFLNCHCPELEVFTEKIEIPFHTL